MTKAMTPIERARELLAAEDFGHDDCGNCDAARLWPDEQRPICRALIAAEERVQELEQAVRWALGEVDDFPAREPGQGAYWWRKELRERAALAKR